MADETEVPGSGGAAAGNDGGAPGASSTAKAPGAGGGAGSPPAEQVDEKQEKRLSQDIDKLRKQLQSKEAEIEAMKRAQLSKEEQLALDLTTSKAALSSLQSRILAAEIKAAAGERGLHADGAAKIFEASPEIHQLVSMDEGGAIVGLEAAMEKLKADYPFLSKPAPAGVTVPATNPGAAQPMNLESLTPAQIANLSSEEYERMLQKLAKQ